MSSIQPRKQRLARYNAPQHVARKQMASHLSEELLLKYNRRSLTVIAGDEVKVMRGDSKDKSGKVVGVDVRARKVTIDGITVKKADGTEVPRPVDPSNLVLVKLNLDDARRRAKLGETEAPEKPAKKPAKKAAKSDEAAEPSEATAKPAPKKAAKAEKAEEAVA